MRNAWLSALLLGCGGLVVSMGACGGSVTFDGLPGGEGIGGAGGTGSTTQGVTTTTNNSVSATSTSISSSISSSSGPGCSCQAMCGTLQGCGLTGPECPSYCDSIPQYTKDCVCNSGPQGCGYVEQCFSGTGPGPGAVTAVSAVSTGSGGGLPGDCYDCIGETQNQGCAGPIDQCQNSPQCEQAAECLQGCNYTFDCLNQCANQFPAGYSQFYSAISCAVCGYCYSQCSTTNLTNFCLDG